MIAILSIDQLLIKGMSEVAFKIVKGYSPPKPLVDSLEPQPDLNKKNTFNNTILTGNMGNLWCNDLRNYIFNVFNNLKHKFLN